MHLFLPKDERLMHLKSAKEKLLNNYVKQIMMKKVNFPFAKYTAKKKKSLTRVY